MTSDESTIYCAVCHRPLIKRMKNGLWHFMFGKRRNKVTPAIDLYVMGNMKIRCWHGDCEHWNVLSYLPNNDKN